MELVARKLHIGKHASFHAEVTIHDLLNVPLVTGKFSCKWRFKNHISLHSALTGEAAASSSLLHPRSALHISRHAKGSDSSSGSDDDDDDDNDESPAGRKSTDSRRTSHSGHGGTSPAPRSQLIPPGRTMSSNTARPGRTESPSHDRPEAHGITDAVPLSKHTANWEDRSIFCPVSAPVGKDGELGLCPLKFVIRQTFHTEQGKVEESRLGDVVVNLSEFADPSRNSTRRFLLNNSKVNALLRITVRLQHVGGVVDFHAPPQHRNKTHGKDKEHFKKKNASSESLSSTQKGRQGSKDSNSNKDKESPTSSVHSKRSGDSRSGPPRSIGSGQPPLYNPTFAMSAIGSPPGHRQHPPHHAPEAIIEHLFDLSLDEMPVPAEPLSPVKQVENGLPDEPSSPHHHSPRRPETTKSGSTSSHHSHGLFHHPHLHLGNPHGSGHSTPRLGEETPA